MTDLFSEVVARCGLSPVFAKGTIGRALQREELTPETLTADGLRRCEAHIRSALALFLTRKEIEDRMADIMSLADEHASGSRR